MAKPRVEQSFSEPHLRLTCACGWTGYDDDIERWDVEADRDRVVRCCPSCDDSVPEWGTVTSVEGVARVARGPLRAALAEAGTVDD